MSKGNPGVRKGPPVERQMYVLRGVGIVQTTTRHCITCRKDFASINVRTNQRCDRCKSNDDYRSSGL